MKRNEKTKVRSRRYGKGKNRGMQKQQKMDGKRQERGEEIRKKERKIDYELFYVLISH